MISTDVEPPKRGTASLLARQLEVVRDTTSKIIVCQGGYRSGKTTALLAKAIDLGRRHWPHPVLAVGPSFPMVRSVLVEGAQDLCAKWKLACRWRVSTKTLTIGRRYPVTIWCRSADSPRSLEGLTVGSLIGDEWELWDVTALKVAMARVSIGPLQQIVLGGTPEGFGPGYRLLLDKPAAGTRLIVMRTIDNTNVRHDYVDDMRSRLSESEAAEKLEGVRTAPEGRVFTRFDREVHTRFCAVDARGADMQVWCGFNESRMAWAFVLVDSERGLFHVVGELVQEQTDSQAMAQQALAWLAEWHAAQGRRVTYRDLRSLEVTAICDPDGQERAARAPMSHVANLQEAGFKPLFTRRNPRVEDRVASMQKSLAEKRITFDEDAAPYFTRCIAMQRKHDDGNPLLDGDLQYGAAVLTTGVMWHSPAVRPATAYTEQQRTAGIARARHRETPPMRQDVLRKIPSLIRNRFAQAAPGGRLAGDPVVALGCSIEAFALGIEKQFTDGMSWENHGLHGWHLDHVRPLSSFDLTSQEHLARAAHHTNYQPMWARENKSKGNRWNAG